MRKQITTIVIIVVLAALATACSTSSDADETTIPATATTVAPTTTTEPPPDPAEVAEATQAASVEAFLTQDIDSFAALITDDYEFFDPTTGAYTSGSTTAISKMEGLYGWTDAEQTELIERFVSDDGTRGTVVYRWVATTGFGSDVDVIMTQIHEYEDGKVRTVTNYYGTRDAYDQIMGS